jgi:hypothetical protein
MHVLNSTFSSPDVDLVDHKGPFLTFARSAIDAMFGFLWYAAVCVLGLFATNNNGLVYAQNDGEYLLGLGIGDITGPVVETNMMVRFVSFRCYFASSVCVLSIAFRDMRI